MKSIEKLLNNLINSSVTWETEKLLKAKQEILSRFTERAKEMFNKGRKSVLTENRSGCCCEIDENDTVISLCACHKELFEEKDRKIAELEEQKDIFKDAFLECKDKIYDKENQIADLQKEKDNEAENCRLMNDRLQRLIEGNKILQKQVDDMKCCGNCDYYNGLAHCNFEDWKETYDGRKCKGWKMYKKQEEKGE